MVTDPGEELYESNECITFFTEKGYRKFLNKIAHLAAWFIPMEVIVVPDTNENLLYSDKYQKVFRKGEQSG